MAIEDPSSKIRAPDHPAERIFVDAGRRVGHPGSDPGRVLSTFFEAARWAPSTFNSQPWRSLYALLGQSEFEILSYPFDRVQPELDMRRR
nr:nitroreductase family protein [Bradyrhizobium murdochi]